jgi:hypothetical protein
MFKFAGVAVLLCLVAMPGATFAQTACQQRCITSCSGKGTTCMDKCGTRCSVYGTAKRGQS